MRNFVSQIRHFLTTGDEVLFEDKLKKEKYKPLIILA